MDKIFNIGASLNHTASAKSKNMFSEEIKKEKSAFKETLDNKVNKSSSKAEADKHASTESSSDNIQKKNKESNKTSESSEKSSSSKDNVKEDDDAKSAATANTIGNTDFIAEDDLDSETSEDVALINGSVGDISQNEIEDANKKPDLELELGTSDDEKKSRIMAAEKRAGSIFADSVKDTSSMRLQDQDVEVNSEMNVIGRDALLGKNTVEVASQTDIKNVNVAADINDPKWGDEFAQKIQVLINVKTKEAKISINPKELGPIKIQIEKSDNDLKIAFNSSTNRVSEVIESNLSKLRDLVENEGMNLLDVSVHSNEQNSKEQGKERGTDLAPGLESSSNENASGENIVKISDNIIDFYA